MILSASESNVIVCGYQTLCTNLFQTLISWQLSSLYHRCRCKVWEPIHNALLHSSRRMLRPHQKLGLQGHGAPLPRELGRAQSQRPLDGEEWVRERGGDQDLVCSKREGRRGTQQRFAHEGRCPRVWPRPASLLERGAQARRASCQSIRVSVASNLTRYYAKGVGREREQKGRERERKRTLTLDMFVNTNVNYRVIFPRLLLSRLNYGKSVAILILLKKKPLHSSWCCVCV